MAQITLGQILHTNGIEPLSTTAGALNVALNGSLTTVNYTTTDSYATAATITPPEGATVVVRIAVADNSVFLSWVGGYEDQLTPSGRIVAVLPPHVFLPSGSVLIKAKSASAGLPGALTISYVTLPGHKYPSEISKVWQATVPAGAYSLTNGFGLGLLGAREFLIQVRPLNGHSFDAVLYWARNVNDVGYETTALNGGNYLKTYSGRTEAHALRLKITNNDTAEQTYSIECRGYL